MHKFRILLAAFTMLLAPTSGSADTNVLSFEAGTVLREFTSEHGGRDAPEWTALATIDGTTKLGWSSQEGAPFPHEFVYEMRSHYSIHAIEIDNRDSDEPSWPGISAAEFTVSGSAVGPTGPFVELFSGRANSGDLTRFESNSPQKVRWIKLSISSNGGDAQYTELMELRAFTKETGPNAASTAVSSTYATNWNNFFLQVGEDGLVGCYDHDNGFFNGAQTDNFLSLEWVEDGPQIGKAVLALSADGAVFNGWWYEGGELRGAWIGNRISEAEAPICAQQFVEQPKSKLETSLERTGRAVIYGIYFDFDSATLKPSSEPALQELSAWLTAHPNTPMRIEGHTDSDGSDSYNQDLSARRAATVQSWLVSKGHTVSRFSSLGAGEGSPVASNSTAEGRALNRRVEVHLQ